MITQFGIDAGGSLVKIVFKEKGQFHFKTYPVAQAEAAIRWLDRFAPEAIFRLTGGKSGLLFNLLQGKGQTVDEFVAVTMGTRHLLQEEGKGGDSPFILVSIGTGTSIYFVDGNRFERMNGSGIGGGTLLGLGKLLTGSDQFHELVRLASQGKRDYFDLLVKDIYTPGPPPIPGHLTAANFGKIPSQSTDKGDAMAALIQMLGETILLLATQAAKEKQTEQIVFIGSTLEGNIPLKNVLASFQGMFRYEPIFLEKGAYAGAVGAYLS